MKSLDIWEVIADVLEQHKTICVIAFFAHYYYNHPIYKVAEMLGMESRDVEYWLAKIKTDIHRQWHKLGGQIGPGGKGITDPNLDGYFEESVTYSRYEDDDEEYY